MESESTHNTGSQSTSSTGYPNRGNYRIYKETDKVLRWVMSCLGEGKMEGAKQCIHSGLFKAFYAGRECEKQNSANREVRRGEL